MVGMESADQISRISIQLGAAFAVAGVGLLYLAIAISSVPDVTKILWASALSLAVGALFLIIWTMAKDTVRSYERELKRKASP
jgi:hypothetical protein